MPVVIDSLEYVHRLEAAGVPRAQAEVFAQALASLFVHNLEVTGYQRVTKDYLDVRFAESEAKMDRRLAQLEAKIDIRFAQLK
jgi:hypothetical protein